MATAEQPLKKRKLYDVLPTDSSLETGPPTPLSQEEILRRRRNQEEVRNVYEAFKTLKRYTSSKDPHFLPNIERSYLSLIAASRGCRSVQRIVSKFVPLYASYCPTALESATKVIINIHNWSFPLISIEEYDDGITLDIAINCIAGLAEICCAASRISPTSSVMQGICSVVFRTVLSFFASNMEGKDLFQIIDKEALKMQDSAELFSKMKQKVSSGNEHPLQKLSKLRALSLLQIIFSCPRDLLAVCFNLIITPATEGCYQEGKYFLGQLVNGLNSVAEKDSGGSKVMMEISETSATVEAERNHDNDTRPFSRHNCIIGDVSFDLKDCLIGLLLKKNPSLKSWILSIYKQLSQSAPSESVSDLLIVLQRILEPFKDAVSDEEYSVASTLPPYAGSHLDDSCKTNLGSRSMDFKNNDQADARHSRSSISIDLPSNQLSSPILRKSLNLRGNICEAGEQLVQEVEKNQISDLDTTGVCGKASSYAASKNHMEVTTHCTHSGAVWICDGDPAAMDVFSASRQLWLGSLPPEASEGAVRYQLERFGHLEYFFICPAKGFALVEYRGIMDAIKAREYMRTCSPWNAPIRVKFMDTALGSRGVIDGVAVGSSCFVYVGHIFSQWMKDDILRETMKAVYRGPRMVTELANEGALLLEFGTPEDAVRTMCCLRQHRRGNNAPRSMSSNMLGSPHTPGYAESHSGMHTLTPHSMRADRGPDFISPRPNSEKHGLMQGGPLAQSNWPQPCTDRAEAGTPKGDIYNSSVGGPVPPQGTVSRTPDPTWTYRKTDYENHSVPGPASCLPMPTLSPTVAPSPQIQPPHYMRPVPPVYYPPSNSWDPHSMNHNVSYSVPSISVNVMPPNVQAGAIPPPFIPASVTPLSQMNKSGTQQYNQVAYQSVAPPAPSVPPPLPPSPPPLPPPSSPPPPPPPDSELANMGTAKSSLQIRWQGSLSKSGVHYCTISAYRLDSHICKYLNDRSEPADWPVKLDMTKRTDFRHVQSTFTNAQPHRREVCQLLPASPEDHKGFQDFVSYLKQRECAGVIKIPAVNSIWTRLLFILPCSPEACSLLSVTPNPSNCLIAVIMPKDTNLD